MSDWKKAHKQNKIKQNRTKKIPCIVPYVWEFFCDINYRVIATEKLPDFSVPGWDKFVNTSRNCQHACRVTSLMYTSLIKNAEHLNFFSPPPVTTSCKSCPSVVRISHHEGCIFRLRNTNLPWQSRSGLYMGCAADRFVPSTPRVRITYSDTKQVTFLHTNLLPV